MNEKTFKCYGCMSEKPLSEQSNYFVRVICIETKETSINPVCKSCREKFLKMNGEQDGEKCEHAEKHNGKCLGYQKSEWNDEPTEQCERCEFYEGLKDGGQEKEVKCKDCKNGIAESSCIWCYKHHMPCGENYHCSDGERKGGQTDGIAD